MAAQPPGDEAESTKKEGKGKPNWIWAIMLKVTTSAFVKEFVDWAKKNFPKGFGYSLMILGICSQLPAVPWTYGLTGAAVAVAFLLADKIPYYIVMGLSLVVPGVVGIYRIYFPPSWGPVVGRREEYVKLIKSSNGLRHVIHILKAIREYDPERAAAAAAKEAECLVWLIFECLHYVKGKEAVLGEFKADAIGKACLDLLDLLMTPKSILSKNPSDIRTIHEQFIPGSWTEFTKSLKDKPDLDEVFQKYKTHYQTFILGGNPEAELTVSRLSDALEVLLTALDPRKRFWQKDLTWGRNARLMVEELERKRAAAATSAMERTSLPTNTKMASSAGNKERTIQSRMSITCPPRRPFRVRAQDMITCLGFPDPIVPVPTNVTIIAIPVAKPSGSGIWRWTG